MSVVFELNGESVHCDGLDGIERLSTVLRERCATRDVKVGCEAGDCGACTVMIDGRAVNACTVPVAQVNGARVETALGLHTRQDPDAVALTEAFERHGAVQCGMCFPGMLVSGVALKRSCGHPSDQQVRDALGGVLCRCSGYRKILSAVSSTCGPGARVAGVSDGAVGDSAPRVDGRERVTGAVLFGDDVAPRTSLLLRVVRSPYARARFTLGDLRAWRERHPGVRDVFSASDVPGVNRFGVIPGFEDQPVFAEHEARFPGEGIAAVVGDADAIAGLDLADFPVRWEPLAPVLDTAEAQRASAPQLHAHGEGNVMCRGRVVRGDVESALAAADALVDGQFESGFVEHAYIEPEAGYATCVDGRVSVHGCTQAPVMDQQALAAVLGLDTAWVCVVPTPVGGGFGAKLDLSFQPYVALASLRLGEAVRVCYSRQESMQSTTKRHPSSISLRIGADRAGRLVGFDFRGDFNTGAYASWGPTVANRVPVHASGPYTIPHYRALSAGVYTHNPPAGAFRGFGVPQAAIAQEVLFDELAEQLDLDPLDFRLRNVLRDGAPTVTGQVFAAGVGIGACLEALDGPWRERNAEAERANQANGDGARYRRGVGIACGWYGCGNTSLPNPSTIKSVLRDDGRVLLFQGAVDIGQGANTVIAQIFATALGCRLADVVVEVGDTDVTPDAGKTSASRQTFVSGNAAKRSGEALRRALLEVLGAPAEADLVFEPALRGARSGTVWWPFEPDGLTPNNSGHLVQAEGSYDPPTAPLDSDGQGEPYAQFGYAAHLVDLTVDTALGTVELNAVVAAHDVGCAINPLLVEGQIHGGVAQGIGMALMESYVPGHSEDLHNYLIPTIGDVPPIESHVLEVPDLHGPFGAKGLGEHALIPTAPAILNAIRRATGARLRLVPATPEAVLDALSSAEPQDA
ncbi:MAG: molybdopterin cofactor-binding domain-containing protein [Pseudomonadota bacterium]